MPTKIDFAREIAARISFEGVEQYEANVDGIDVIQYRFNLINIIGDFVLINVPMAFATKDAARLKLYEYLVS